MEQPITAAEANRKFSKVLRDVREGRHYVVTSHGRAVARIVPISRDDGTVNAARAALMTRLRSQQAVDAGKWTRDDLYEDAD
jgi:prevent-host-death family protein